MPEPKTEPREVRIKRILYQSWYRGCKETDRIIGHFCRAHIYELSDENLDALERILEESDKDLFNWLTGVEPMPEEYTRCPVMQQLLAFDVAKAVASE